MGSQYSEIADKKLTEENSELRTIVDKLASQTLQLQNELLKIQYEAAEFDKLKKENSALQARLEIREHFEKNPVPKSIITTDLILGTVPIRMRLVCPECRTLHIDQGEFETKPHHTHQCENCGNAWRPAIENTVGVKFLFSQAKK